LKKCRLQYLMTNILENPLQIDDASVKKVSAPNLYVRFIVKKW
jgi:hypothetical protein